MVITAREALELPPERVRFVVTMNGLGYMRAQVDAYMAAFIAFAKTSAAPVADIGAAYGVATIPALEAGASVIAVDLDERHLEILKSRVPAACLERLRTIAAPFPEGLHFDEESIGAFLLSHVVHFLSPDRLQLAARRMFGWLVAGGKVFLTATSPYTAAWESFLPEYEAGRRAGNPWPGAITDVARYAPTFQAGASSMLLLDPDTLSRVFREAGFLVEKAEFVARPDLPAYLQLDGREDVGLIARKPH